MRALPGSLSLTNPDRSIHMGRHDYISYSLRQLLSIPLRVRWRLGRLSIVVSLRSCRCPVDNCHGFLTLILIFSLCRWKLIP
jgi:hypothetical protein